MNCPNCGKEMRPGIVRARPLRDNKVFWYPENYKNKSIINEEPVALSLEAEGYYCDECMTAFANFKNKEYGFFERLFYKIFDKEY